MSGTPTVGGSYPGLILRAYNGVDEALSQPTTITLDVSTLSYALPSLTERQNVAIEPDASNVALPALYEVVAGRGPLPAGLALDPTTGAITGKPTVAGSFSDLVIQVTDADGATAVAGPYAATVAPAPDQTADLALPDTVAWSSGSLTAASRLNVTRLLSQYNYDVVTPVAPGAWIEINYAAPTKVNGVRSFFYPTATSVRLDADYGSGWRAVQDGIPGDPSSAAPYAIGQTVTARRYRIVNTGSQTFTFGGAITAYNGQYAQLPIVTYEGLGKYNLTYDRLLVGATVSFTPTVSSGGSIVFKQPYAFGTYVPSNSGKPALAHAPPPGLGLDPSTGVLSGTATAISYPGGYDQARYVYRQVVDADGYVAIGAAQQLLVNSDVPASRWGPRTITVGGTAQSDDARTRLLSGTASVMASAAAPVIVKYDSPVALNRVVINASVNANWTVALSLDDGGTWLAPPTVTKSGTTSQTLSLAALATARWVRLTPSNVTTLSTLKVGTDGTYPTVPTANYPGDVVVDVGSPVDNRLDVAGLKAPVTYAFSTTNGDLPAGVGFDTSTGAVTGVPSDILTRQVILATAQDSLGYSVSAQFNMTVHATNTADFTTTSARTVTPAGATKAGADPVTVTGGTGSWTLATGESLELTYAQPTKAARFVAKAQSTGSYSLEIGDGTHWFGVSGSATGNGSDQSYAYVGSFRKIRIKAVSGTVTARGLRATP